MIRLDSGAAEGNKEANFTYITFFIFVKRYIGIIYRYFVDNNDIT